MEVRSVGFGAITASAVRKGMILEKNIGKQKGRQKEIIKARKSGRDKIEITFKWLSGIVASGNSLEFYKQTRVIKDFDLVGWVKRVVTKNSAK